MEVLYTIFTGDTATQIAPETINKFNKSIFILAYGRRRDWRKRRSEELIEHGYRIKRNGVSNYTILKTQGLSFLIIFLMIPMTSNQQKIFQVEENVFLYFKK